MARKKISTTLYMEPWHDAALKGIKARTGMPAATMIRDAIEEYLVDRLTPSEVAEYKRDTDSMDEEVARLKERIASLEGALDEQRRLLRPHPDLDDGESHEDTEG
ncbi:MAG: hypothetical protein AB7W59_00345 [Acidimicrobiia bacterium]